ncbi:MAG TPA: MurR/RpiR family transcriptional regulator, partial [Burkholderiales bacterium]|nr:MurR/RpiR family transcriptional regulator [Burkholderiales bacterium]
MQNELGASPSFNPHAPTRMILQELLERNSDQLTRTDRKLASVLLAHPRDSVFLSTNEIAERAAVHPASAVRLARKLGFAGYPALRSALQMELFNETAAAERVRRRIEHLGKGEVLKAFVQSEIRALSLLPERVDDKRIIAAARAIVRARTVFLFGTGHAETLARLLEIRLARGGYDA